MLKIQAFFAGGLLSVCLAQGVLAEAESVEKHPLLQSSESTSWEERFAEDFPTLEYKYTTRSSAMEILADKGPVEDLRVQTDERFSLGLLSDAVGGAISQVIKAPVNVVEKARGAITGLNPLNLFHSDEAPAETEKLDNTILAQHLEIRSEYANRSYDEWFANQTADALAAQKPAPKDKQRMKIQILLQDFISRDK